MQAGARQVIWVAERTGWGLWQIESMCQQGAENLSPPIHCYCHLFRHENSSGFQKKLEIQVLWVTFWILKYWNIIQKLQKTLCRTNKVQLQVEFGPWADVLPTCSLISGSKHFQDGLLPVFPTLCVYLWPHSAFLPGQYFSTTPLKPGFTLAIGGAWGRRVSCVARKQKDMRRGQS